MSRDAWKLATPPEFEGDGDRGDDWRACKACGASVMPAPAGGWRCLKGHPAPGPGVPAWVRGGK